MCFSNGDKSDKCFAKIVEAAIFMATDYILANPGITYEEIYSKTNENIPPISKECSESLYIGVDLVFEFFKDNPKATWDDFKKRFPSLNDFE